MLAHMAHPFVLLSGDEFLIDREVSRICKAFKAANPDVGISEIDGGADNAGAAFAEAISPDLFGDVPLILVRGIEQADENLQGQVLALSQDQDNQTHALFTVQGGVKGRGFIDKLRKSGVEQIDSPTPAKRELGDFIASEFRSHGRKRPAAEVVDLLRESVGEDLRSLAAAVNQLASDIEGEPISAEAVSQYYEGMAGVAPYQVVDEALKGDVTAALTALRWALERDPGIGPAIVASFASALRELVAVIGASPGMGEVEIAKSAGMPPWKVKVRRGQSRSWPPKRLADAALAVSQAEAALKGGEIDQLGRVEVLDPAQRQALLERIVVLIAALPANR